MQFNPSEFYTIMSPRCTVLITTIDREGNSNAAPFSFVMPVSREPALVVFASAHTRHTLTNVRQTGEFVLNMVPRNILDRMMVCSKPFPKGTSEIKEAGLTARESIQVKPPCIEECAGWIECKLEFEKEAGDHILVVGKVLYVECKDKFIFDGQFDVSKAQLVLHIQGRKFVVAEQVVEAIQV